MHSEDEGINYLLLLIVIIVGVMIGNLLSALVTATYVNYQAKQVVAEVSQALQNQAHAAQMAEHQSQQLIVENQLARQEMVRAQRANDTNGVALGRACTEWRNADANLSSYTTRTEAAKHCTRYDHYIQTGRVSTGR